MELWAENGMRYGTKDAPTVLLFALLTEIKALRQELGDLHKTIIRASGDSV